MPLIKDKVDSESSAEQFDCAVQVRTELLQQAYADLRSGLVAAGLIAGGIAWVAARSVGGLHAGLWFAAMTLVILLRVFSLRRYQLNTRRRGTQYWERWFAAAAISAGLIWGYGCWTFYGSMNEAERSLIMFCMAGFIAGATRSLAPVLYACWGVQLSILLPLVGRLLLSTEPSAHVLAGLTVLFIFFMMTMARTYHRKLGESLRLGLERAALVGELQEKKLISEALNRGLKSEITRREKTENDLRSAMARAEAANVAKSEFLATMSHELRTPMNGIMGMIELLKNTPLDQGQHEQLETASHSADSLMRILNDILDLSKIESGSLNFESIPMHPASVAEEVASLLRPRATQKRLNFILHTDAASRLRVKGDPTRLRQVLANLAGNAVKFTEHGEVELRLSGTIEEGDHLALTVQIRDTGIGMNAATVAQLFQAFTQADGSMSRRYGGTGLGLAISQKLVQRMGGEIAVESHEGNGSVFTFSLMLALAPETPLAPAPKGGTNAPMLTGRILVVEDDPVNQKVIKMMLKRLGLECTVVGDGYAGIDAVMEHEWDFIFMDCQLPGIDGFETTRRIRQTLKGRPLAIVALTANVRPEDRAACLAAGMDDFMPKPARIDTVRACLQRWLPTASQGTVLPLVAEKAGDDRRPR